VSAKLAAAVARTAKVFDSTMDTPISSS
jgi:hypothetical protein